MTRAFLRSSIGQFISISYTSSRRLTNAEENDFVNFIILFLLVDVDQEKVFWKPKVKCKHFFGRLSLPIAFRDLNFWAKTMKITVIDILLHACFCCWSFNVLSRHNESMMLSYINCCFIPRTASIELKTSRFDWRNNDFSRKCHRHWRLVRSWAHDSIITRCIRVSLLHSALVRCVNRWEI